MFSRWQFHIDDKPWAGAKRLFVTCSVSHGAVGLVLPFTIKTFDRGEAHPDEPTLSETRYDQADGIADVTGFLQAALDAAWEHGLRPKGFADHSNELTAVRYHLEDMRTLAKVK